MRLAFLGTPEAAVPSLEALVTAGHDVALVITRPDRRRGRGSDLVASPVKKAALALGLTVSHQLSSLDDLDVERGVVVAYGVIIPASLLQRVPMLNMHFSLLPRWRGAAPVQRAILAGDQETGVSIISLEPSLDTGPVHLELSVRVGDKTAQVLTAELAVLGAAALVEVLSSRELLENPKEQKGDVTYAEKITKEMLHLTSEMASVQLLRTVRLGGAYVVIDDKRLGVVSAHASLREVAAGTVSFIEGEVLMGTIDGALSLDDVRPEGSTTMSAVSWWVGRRNTQNDLKWS
jgi:methionyl-tRNA formyltransferase